MIVRILGGSIKSGFDKKHRIPYFFRQNVLAIRSKITVDYLSKKWYAQQLIFSYICLNYDSLTVRGRVMAEEMQAENCHFAIFETGRVRNSQNPPVPTISEFVRKSVRNW